MNRTTRLLLVVFNCLFITEFANANVGTIENVVIAAMKDEKPAYIEELMQELEQKLQAVAQKMKIENPKQKLAWLHTMNAIIHVIEKTVTDQAVIEIAPSGKWERACDRATVSMSNLSWAAGRLANQNYEHSNPANRTAVATAKYALPWAAKWEAIGAAYHASVIAKTYSATAHEKGRSQWLAGQWGLLNWLQNNIDNLVSKIYQETIKELADRPKNNPFETSDSLTNIVTKEFAGLNNDELMYLSPWLVPIGIKLLKL